ATTYRLHIAIDLINLSLHQVEVTTDKEGENLDHYTLAAGDVVLIDRGYNQPKTLVSNSHFAPHPIKWRKLDLSH
ncbi:hypothetical protein, partial [Thiothrix subterranea]